MSELSTLVIQLEGGSVGAEARLAALLTEGDAPTRSTALDAVASSAAAGSPYALELLLSTVVDGDLARLAITRVVSDLGVIEEVEQEVLVALSRSIRRYRGDARFSTWFFALARNTAISHVRRNRPTAPLPSDELIDPVRRLSSQVAERDLVLAAIDALPPKFRQPVLLRDVEGLSYAEIADREGLRINTVRSRLSRGRALLASRLS